MLTTAGNSTLACYRVLDRRMSTEVVAKVERSDYIALADFLSRFEDETRPQPFWLERFELWWDRNPYFAANASRGYALKVDGRVVGFFGVVPILFQHAHEERVVHGSTTWRTLPEHRSKSLAAIYGILQYVRESMFFVTTSNPTVSKLLEGLRFVRLPRPRALFSPAPKSAFILRLDRVLPHVMPSFASRPAIAKAAGAAFAGYGAVRWAGLKVEGRLRAEEVRHCDASFDALWARTRHLYANTNARTSEFLNWHCFQNRELAKRVFACRRGDEVAGFAVVVPKTPRGVLAWECYDVWSDRSRGVLESIFAEIIAAGWREGVAAIELPHFSTELVAFARRHGWIARNMKANDEYVLAKKETLDRLTPESSYFCWMQGDIGL